MHASSNWIVDMALCMHGWMELKLAMKNEINERSEKNLRWCLLTSFL